MFDKMKQMYELQKRAREIQKKLETIQVSRTEGGHEVAVNGLLKIVSLKLDPGQLNPESKEKLEKTLQGLISETILEVQKRSAAESQSLFKGLTL